MTSSRHLRRAGVLIGAAALLQGCAEEVADFIEVSGTYQSGQTFSLREAARRVVCDATALDAPCVSLKALKLTSSTSEILWGIRIDYQPSKIVLNVRYSPAPMEPVVLYAVHARPGKFVDSSTLGGEIRFTSVARAPGESTRGTFEGMALYSAESIEPLLFIEKGSFHFMQP